MSISIGDLDGDGAPDLAVANGGSSLEFPGDVSVLLGVGDGTFAAPQSFAAGDRPVSVSIGDLDGDGAPDLAVANFNSDDVSVLLGIGDGTFAAEQRFAAGVFPQSMSIGDLDGDGVPDLAVANGGSFADMGDVSVLLGAGDGTFAAQQRFDAGDSPQSVSIGDLDGDGAPDLAVANGNSDDVSVLLNRGISPADIEGDGVVGSSDLGALLAAWGSSAATALDLDGDGVVGSGDLGILMVAWGG